jgi:hypothetical protein
MAARKKSETKIIRKAKARITTRTGEIPSLIPNLSGCARVSTFTWRFLVIYAYFLCSKKSFSSTLK